jgi:hypothetical protein
VGRVAVYGACSAQGIQGIEALGRFVALRCRSGTQSVKSTSYRLGNGYLCGFKPNQTSKSRYTTRRVDFFAALIVPKDIWYIIPASVVLQTLSSTLMLCPVQQPMRDCYLYQGYREAWKLLRGGPKHG